MSYTTEQLAKLKEAYASGVRTVTHGDNSVTYSSMAELKAAIDTIEGQLVPKKRRILRTYATDRGFR